MTEHTLYANQPSHTSLIDGQRHALIATGAGGYEENAEGMIEAFGRMQKYHKAIHAGTLFIDSCTTPDALGEPIKQNAIRFARQIGMHVCHHPCFSKAHTC